MPTKRLDYNLFEANESHFPAMAECSGAVGTKADDFRDLLIKRYYESWNMRTMKEDAGKAGKSDIVEKVRIRIAYPKPGQDADTSEMHGYAIWVHHDKTTPIIQQWIKDEKIDPAKSWGM